MLPGRSLADLAEAGVVVDDGPARYDLGVALAALHRVTGERFGYDDDRAGGPTWRAAFTAMLDALLADAADWDVRLPVTPEQLHALVGRHADVLDEVRRPALLHFDCWDGNVLAAPDADGRLRLRGLVDGERFLYGDPLLDLVSPLLFRRVEDEPEHPLLRGYQASRSRTAGAGRFGTPPARSLPVAPVPADDCGDAQPWDDRAQPSRAACRAGRPCSTRNWPRSPRADGRRGWRPTRGRTPPALGQGRSIGRSTRSTACAICRLPLLTS